MQQKVITLFIVHQYAYGQACLAVTHINLNAAVFDAVTSCQALVFIMVKSYSSYDRKLRAGQLSILGTCFHSSEKYCCCSLQRLIWA